MMSSLKYLRLVVLSVLLAMLMYTLRYNVFVESLDTKILNRLNELWMQFTMPLSGDGLHSDSSTLRQQSRLFSVVNYANLIYEDSAKVNAVNKLSLKWRRSKHRIQKNPKHTFASVGMPQPVTTMSGYNSDMYYQAEGIFWPNFNRNVILSNAGTPVNFEAMGLPINQNYIIASLLDLDMSNRYYNQLLNNKV